MILMNSFNDSGKNEVLFVKIGTMVLDFELDTCFDKGFWPKLLQTSFKASDPKSHSFEIQFFFHVKLHKILHETSTYFQILRHF